MIEKLKYIIFFTVFLVFCKQVNSQILSNNPIINGISGETPFLDASSYFNPEMSGSNNIGKGLVFPRTDLTSFQFIKDMGGYDALFPSYYDGMIVYNVGTGLTSNIQGIKETFVYPGFYYFKNLDGVNNYSIVGGQWIRLTNDLDLMSQTVSVSAVAPSTATVGMVYFNTTDNQFYKCTAIGPPDTWIAVSSGGGGTGKEFPYETYNPSGNKKFFCRASGPGVTASLDGNTLTITIPAGVFLDYFKFSTSYTELGSQNNVQFVIDDQNKKWNNSIDDVIVPVVNLVDRVQVSPTIVDNVFSSATNTMQLVVTEYSNGVLKMYSGSVGDHQSASGFYFTFHF